PERRRLRVAAERALLDGDAQSAIDAWQTVHAATPDDTFAELQLARAQGSAGDFAKAVEGLDALTARDPNDPRAWFELGKFVLLSGDAQRAVDDYLVRALVLYKRSRDLFGEAETVNALGIGYGRLGQTADAAEQYRKAVELRRALGNRRGVATSLRNLANVLALTGQFDEAAGYLEQARTLQAELGDREGLAATDNEMGLLAEERGDYPAALAHFRRALQGWRQAGDAHGSAEALNNIGFAHFQLGAFDDAEVYWKQAAEAYQKLGSRTGEIRTGQNLGLLAIARGQWNDARRLLDASLASAQQQQMPEEAAVSHRNLADMELLQGRIDAALRHLDKAEALFVERQDQRGILDVGLLRAQAWLRADAADRARKLLDELQPSLRAAATEQRAIAQLLRAELADRDGDTRGAALALREARQLAEASGVRALELQIALRDARAGRVATGLDADISALGHAGLRLQWLEWKMREALQQGDAAGALDAYREALILLRDGEFGSSWNLHQLAAQAHEMQGDDAQARRARARSDQSRAAFTKALPESLRPAVESADAPEPKPPGPGPSAAPPSRAGEPR
ncbi:MAG: tetratricopeptide repeat protein, partial [Pseudomonadota bacterium]|nr:tetratricopeptide repeat protein [Pseudomonadota bacterium]